MPFWPMHYVRLKTTLNENFFNKGVKQVQWHISLIELYLELEMLKVMWHSYSRLRSATASIKNWR